METEMDGETPPPKIDNGIDDYYAGVLDYNGRSYYTGDKKGLLRDEINNDYPCLLNLWSGDRAEDEPSTYPAYGNHSVAVVGYVDNGDQIEIHDTWDDERHRLNWGAWIDISITTVHPE